MHACTSMCVRYCSTYSLNIVYWGERERGRSRKNVSFRSYQLNAYCFRESKNFDLNKLIGKTNLSHRYGDVSR